MGIKRYSVLPYSFEIFRWKRGILVRRIYIAWSEKNPLPQDKSRPSLTPP
jgi:hypothetical protein